MGKLNRRKYDYLIVGAGIAGMSAARAIRERDGAGSLALVSGEDRLPYKRTKISKNIAAGFARDAFALESEEWYRENRIDLLAGESVVSIDPRGRLAGLRTGGEIEWRRLILATGAAPILPTGVAAPEGGLHVVRTASDVEGLEQGLAAAKRVIVVGGGVLAVEVAEQVRSLDKEVVLVGSDSRLLARHLDPEASAMLEGLLEEKGVQVVANERIASVERLSGGRLRVADRAEEGTSGRPGAHSAGTGSAVAEAAMWEGDLVVVCAGVRPNVEVAREAGIAVGRGILVDEYLRTSLPGAYAAGDAAEHPGGYLSFLWHAAELQGEIAGANAAGAAMRHEQPPFRLKCEVFDRYFFSMAPPASAAGCETVSERSGERYRRLFYREGRLRGVVMANDKERAKSYVTAVREGWSRERVAELLSW